MIDTDKLKGLITEDIIEEALSRIEGEYPQYSGMLPRHSIAKMVVEYALDRVSKEEEVVKDQHTHLGFCVCMNPLNETHLDLSYCNNCGRSIYLHIGRVA